MFDFPVANGVYQNTVYGMAAKLPPKYTGVVIIGSNISGTFVTVISIISELFSPNSRTAAIYYFIAALFILLLCFDTYFALPLNVSTNEICATTSQTPVRTPLPSIRVFMSIINRAEPRSDNGGCQMRYAGR